MLKHGKLSLLLICWMAFVYFLSGCSNSAPARSDNPLQSARVGDWIKLKSVYVLNGQTYEEFVRKEVVKKDATTVTLKTASTFSQEDIAAYETEEVVAINSWDELLNLANTDGVTVELLANAVEDMPVGNSTLASSKETYRVTMKSAEEEGIIDMTYWVCPQVPIFGAVRVAVKVDGATPVTATTDVVDFGHGQ